MKRAILCIAIAVLGTTIAVFGQGVKFGLVVRPQLATQNVENPSKNGDTAKFVHKESNFRFAAGILLDMYMGENVAFGIGALYNTKGSNYKYDYKLSYFSPLLKDTSITVIRNLQYVELPVTLKFFTNDLANGLRIYGQVGSGVNILISAKGGKDGTEADYYNKTLGTTVEFKSFVQMLDVTFKFTFGLEIPLGGDTRFFAGLVYDRGLINTYQAIDDKAEKLYDKYLVDMVMKNNTIGMELGIKF